MTVGERLLIMAICAALTWYGTFVLFSHIVAAALSIFGLPFN
jgi:hypothetical protein